MKISSVGLGGPYVAARSEGESETSVRMLRLTIGGATADMAGKGWRSLDG
jgi:hypothetical protein